MSSERVNVKGRTARMGLGLCAATWALLAAAGGCSNDELLGDYAGTHSLVYQLTSSPAGMPDEQIPITYMGIISLYKNGEAMQIDLLSFSAHKLYGPKGVGALYVRRKPRVRLEAQMDGGGHERGLRSGTLNVPGIVGFAKACELAQKEMATESARIASLRDRLESSLMKALPHVFRNGSAEHRLPGNANLSFAYVEGEGLLMALKDVAVSSGSACTSASLEPSYVLRALGVGDELAHTSIRFGLGRFSTVAEVDYVIELVVRSVERLRSLSPLWEMHQDGIDLSTIQWTPH